MDASGLAATASVGITSADPTLLAAGAQFASRAGSTPAEGLQLFFNDADAGLASVAGAGDAVVWRGLHADVTFTKVGADQRTGDTVKLGGAKFNLYRYVGSVALGPLTINGGSIDLASTTSSQWAPVIAADGTVGAPGVASNVPYVFESSSSAETLGQVKLTQLTPASWYMLVKPARLTATSNLRGSGRSRPSSCPARAATASTWARCWPARTTGACCPRVLHLHHRGRFRRARRLPDERGAVRPALRRHAGYLAVRGRARGHRAHCDCGRAAPHAARHLMRAREGVRRALMTACLLAGIALLLYPVVGTYLNERSFNDAVSHYEEAVRTLPDDERERMLAEARAYNDSLRGDPVRDPFVPNSGYAVPGNYDDVLDVDGTGLMGTVSIPSIGLALPVYHGTSDDVLAHGAGHIPQTSLPVGGAGTHAVLTGHTGLPTARLFTDLERLKEGDVFVIEVLGERRAYAVDDVRVVEPDDVSSIRVDGEREYVTLLTCTPYGVNSHRLLVRGAPCELPDDEVLAPAAPVPWPLVGALAAAAAAAAVLAVRAVRRRRRARTPGGGS